MSATNTKVITRIAPSPTGYLHVGTARSALFNFLFARKHGGTFVLRIEDTDRERSKPEFEKDIIESLSWLNISHDRFARQSERIELYQKRISLLIDSGAAYVSREESKTNLGKEVELIRLKNPGKVVTFTDMIRGEVSFNTTELGDFVIARGINDPLYHLAVVVDDHDMGITHIIRGEDHISNTPRQILIQEALDIPRTHYAHIPLILAPDRSRLSKRHGAVAVSEYRSRGYLPEAIVNYLALLGWNPGTEQEIFSLDELIRMFNIEQVQKGGAIFNNEKLDWFNRHYLRNLPEEEFWGLVKERLPYSFSSHKDFSEDRLRRALPHIQERISTFADITRLVEEGELDFYVFTPSPSREQLLGPRKEYSPEHVKEHLHELVAILEKLPEEAFEADSIKEAIWDFANKKGRGEVLWPMRVALSGKDKSPNPFHIAEIVGKHETLARLRHTLDILGV